jgi:hypothetical protein
VSAATGKGQEQQPRPSVQAASKKTEDEEEEYYDEEEETQP